MSDHGEAIALARRLAAADTETAGACRRALLLYWYGSGASRLRLEEDTASLARLSAQVAAVAADPHPTPEAVRQIGLTLEALVTQRGAARLRPAAGAR